MVEPVVEEVISLGSALDEPPVKLRVFVPSKIIDPVPIVLDPFRLSILIVALFNVRPPLKDKSELGLNIPVSVRGEVPVIPLFR